MRTLHGRGVKGFVTFNTLVFDHELKQCEEAIIAIANAGVDAVIVQDVGVCRLIQRVAPELEIHGSTQMSITSAQGAKLALSLGCNRVVLGRELSLSDMRIIADATDVELEVFVHGALCVSYSGQCFSSEAWGGRSANRGKCAQACRLSYDLIVDGEERDLGPYRYLLSPGDLYAVEQIPELIDIGIACVKIEGRYKDAEYVALTTSAYREAIDLAMMGLPNEITSEERRDLEQIYSRGLGAHFMTGTDHQSVVRGRAPRHRGVKAGQVSEVGKNFVTVKPDLELKRGDGIVFDAADWRSPDEPEEGGNVYEVSIIDGIVKLEFGRGEIDFNRIRVGDWVWRTRDPVLGKKTRALTKTEKPVFTRAVFFEVSAEGGLPIEITATIESGLSAKFTGDHPLEPARNRGLDHEMLVDKLGRLGGSPFHLAEVTLLTDDPVFVQTSVLNQARRELVASLIKQSEDVPSIEAKHAFERIQSEFVVRKEAYLDQLLTERSSNEEESTVGLHLLVRNGEQLDAAIDAANQTDVASITLDYLELYGLRPSVEKIRAAGLIPRVASPRVLKPSEQNVIRFLLSLECDIVIRSGGLLFDLVNMHQKGESTLPNLIGDFSLNTANFVTAWHYLDLGLSRVTPTYDLNAEQITDLTTHFPSPALEVIAYSHLPVFHTEHCVFCRFLSDGTDNTNCGHPCEKHQVSVRDSQGRAHAVMADVGCRNTIFGAEAQTNPHAIVDWQTAGISNFRLEFVHQTPEQVRQIIAAFGEFFGSQSGSTRQDSEQAERLAALLATISPQSTTEGSLFVPDRYRKLIQLR